MDDQTIACIRCLKALQPDDIVSFLQICNYLSIKNGCEVYCKIQMFLELDDEDKLEIIRTINFKLLNKEVI